MRRFLWLVSVLLLTVCESANKPYGMAREVSAAETSSYYVSPGGSNRNPGTTASSPFRTIQKAIDLAQPGATIHLAAGKYRQDFRSRRDGTAVDRIVVTGPPTAVVQGSGGPAVAEVNHDFLTLSGFTLDGRHSTLNRASSYRSRLLLAQGREIRAGVTGLRVVGLTVRNAARECIRFRYFAQRNEIANTTVANCGMTDFRYAGGGKNGEGIYIGTPTEQLADGTNPTSDRDGSTANWVHDSVIAPNGSECVDLEEGADATVLERNRCSAQRDIVSAGLRTGSSRNVVRHNTVSDVDGVAVELGDTRRTDGVGNDVYENTLNDGGVRVMATPQGTICRNTGTGAYASGSHASRYDPAGPCPRPGVDTTGPRCELRRYEGPLRIKVPGTTLECVEIDGSLDIRADNVTLRNVHLRTTESPAVYAVAGTRNTLIEYSELDGQLLDTTHAGVVGDNVTVRRSHLHGFVDAIKIGDKGLYEANYIQAMEKPGSSSHIDGMQAEGNGGPEKNRESDWVIRGNNIEKAPSQTSSIILKTDIGSIDNGLIEGNWLSGGSHTLYVRQGGAAVGCPKAITVRDNQFVRNAVFGPVSTRGADHDCAAGMTWEDNVYEDGQVITLR